jgi:membrane associated rhomboid family serine protease
MLLPIGHDTGTVRRNPWVTYVLMLACLGVFVVTKSSNRDIARQYALELKEAVQYFAEHPYLMPPDALEPYLGSDWEEQREGLLKMREQAGLLTPPRFQREKEQAELDTQMEEAIAVRGFHPFFRWGLINAHPTLAGAFGYMFLHSGWGHLLGNMLLLFLTGPFIEDKWGRPVFLSFYLLAGLAGAGLFMSRFPHLETPLVGASGAVAGCMGAFLVRFWRAKLRYLVWFVFVGFTFSAPAWLMLPLWFGGEFLSARLTEQVNPMGGAGVAYWAHVGGFAFGALVALGLRVAHIEERWMDNVVDRKIGAVSNDSVEAAMQAAEEGRTEEAFEQMQRVVRSDPKNREAAQVYWDQAVALGRADEAAPVLLRLVREEVRAGETELAVQHWMEFAQRGDGLPVEPVLALRLAQELVKQGHRNLATEVLRRGLASPELNATVALRLARAARPLDPRLCGEAARKALDGAAPAEAAEAQALLDEVGDVAEPPAVEVHGATLDPMELDAVCAAPLEQAEAPPGAPSESEPVEPGIVDADPGDLDLDDADLDGLDLSELGLDDDSALKDFSDPSLEALDDPASQAEAAPPETLSVEPPLPPAVAPLSSDPGAGVEPGTFDAGALAADFGPVSEDAGGTDWGTISLDDAPATEATPPVPEEIEVAPLEPPAPQLRPLRAMEAVPLRLREDSLSLEIDGRGKTRLRFDKIDAVSAAAVRLPGRERPVLLVDLALNFRGGGEGPLQVVRLRSDRFDPRRLVEGEAKPLLALRRLVETLLERSGAAARPDRATACGQPRFAAHDSLADYEREVLLADSGARSERG